MHKKFYAWILAAALVFNLPAVKLGAAEDGFTDIGNHWAKELVNKFTDQGILTGYPDGTFKPDNYLLRSEAVTLLNKYFNITQSGYPNFKDVKPEDWFYFQVGAAHERGYINGYPDGSFKPDNKVSHMEAYIMLYNLLGMPQYNNVSVLDRFTDYNTIPADKPVYRQTLAYMAANGLINTYEDGSLHLYDYVKRAEMLSLLNKISDMIMNNNTSMSPEVTPVLTPAATHAPTPTLTPAPQVNAGGWSSPLAPGNYGFGWTSPGALWPASPGSLYAGNVSPTTTPPADTPPTTTTAGAAGNTTT